MRSKCPAGRAARSMPARSSSRKKSGATMAKTDGARRRDAAKLASPERVAAFRTGLSAESRAAAWLIAKGYRILAGAFARPMARSTSWRAGAICIAFVEVKARASLDEAAYAVTPRQQQRIIAAAQAWLMAHPEHAEFDTAFRRHADCARRLPRHLLAAFDASATKFLRARPDLYP